MTAEEIHIIGELLNGCSPTVQLNAENKFSISAHSDEETDDIEEDSNEATYLVMEDIDNASHRDGHLKLLYVWHNCHPLVIITNSQPDLKKYLHP